MKATTGASTFRDALTSAYLESPCQVLPNALWKTLRQAGRLDTRWAAEGGRVSHLEAWGEEGLLVHWQRERERPQISHERLAGARMALVHQDFVAGIPHERFQTRRPYFRLLHRGACQPPPLPAGLRFAPVETAVEAGAVAGLVARCYDDLRPTAAEVKAWAAHPVYAADLWLWLWDEARGAPAGLGLAELDPTIGEASLEWIQVLPEYRGRRLGRCLVLELLRRAQGRAAFTTVSGKSGDRDPAERFYRACGFGGHDVWWLLQD